MMVDVALLLGPIAFQDFEVPSAINFGGAQRLALHRLAGGARVIDVQGRDDAQIRFSGVISGADATLRARSLDELRVAGMVLPLTWDVFYYSVLISEFRADYRNGRWIPYQITCTVLQDEASSPTQVVASLAANTFADIRTAAVYADDAGLDLSTLQSAVIAPGATVRSTAAYTATQSGINEAQSYVDASIQSADGMLSHIALEEPVSPDGGVDGLLRACDVTGRLSALTLARSYVCRAATNLANAST
jgi:hypothetical protein